jgi:hypothetical protein
MLSGDIRHHPLKAGGVALFIELVAKVGVNHLMSKGPGHLGYIIVHIPKKLLGKVDAQGAELTKAPAISAEPCRGSHSSIPHHRNIRNLSIEMHLI